jgi:hypothetical protein
VAEQLRGASLQLVDRRILTQLLVADLGRSHRRAHRLRRPRRRIRPQVDHVAALALEMRW